MTRIFLGLGVVALSGCVSLNPVTMVQLARLDPLTADPTQMAVALDLPEGVGVAEGSAHMRLYADHQDGAGFDERFELVQSAQDVWRVEPGAQDRFRAAQARALAWEQADADAASGGFSVGFEPCTLDAGPGADARVSLSLQLEPGARFLPLFNEVPVTAFMEDADLAALRPCGSAD
ncbi:hypothetical protein [Gymnodinialimonas sp.]